MIGIYLIEAQNAKGDEFKPIGIVLAHDEESAMAEADRRYATNTHCRKVRQPVSSKELVEFAKKCSRSD